MKKALLIILNIIPFCVFGQYEGNFLKNYSDYLSNPAVNPLEPNTRLRVNLLATDVRLGSTSAKLSLTKSGSLKAGSLRQNTLGNEIKSTGFGNVSLIGPSLSFHVDKTSSISITTRMRVLANYWDLDGRIGGEIGETIKHDHTYPYSLNPEQRMRINVGAFSDLGVTYFKEIYSSPYHRLSAGATVRYLVGNANTSLTTQDLTGNVKINRFGETSYLSASTGSISTRTSGNLLNDFNISNFASGGLGSISTDIGVAYKFFSDPSDDAYKLHIGFSVIDIGKVRYQADSNYSKSYSVHIPDSENGLYFNENFQNSSFARASETFDRYPNFFTGREKNSNFYKIQLPTTIQAFADYRINDHAYLLASASVGTTKQNTINDFFTYKSIMLSPRWISKDFSVSLPLTYQQYLGFNAGLGVRWKQLFLSSKSILTGISDSKSLDLQLGISFVARNSGKKSRGTNDNIESTKTNDERENNSGRPSTFADLFEYQTHLLVTGTPSNATPYWLRANQFGSVPLSGVSSSAIGEIKKVYDPARKNKLVDWAMGIEGRYNVGRKSEMILVESYLKGRLGIFELKMGRSKDVMGLIADSTLSLGSFSVSGNALGIPQIALSIPQYFSLPFTKNWVSVKGNFSHGWVGIEPLGTQPSIIASNRQIFTFFHQKSFYARLGKPTGRLQLYGGFNHQAFWSNTKTLYGPKSRLSSVETFWYIVSGKKYGDGLIETSKLGNHLGTIDLGLEYDFANVRLGVYRQNFYDVGALSKLANIRDGLNGVKLENKVNSSEGFQWKKILLEYFHSVDQAGQLWSKPTKSGDEDYYNNYLYTNGWSYRGVALGNPIITTKSTARTDLRSRADEFFINNRVSAFNLAFAGSLKDFGLTSKLTYSRNFGTYGTSPIGSSLGSDRDVIAPPYFQRVNQFSGIIEVSKAIRNGIRVSAALSVDRGKLLYNSTGGYLKISKSWK